MYDNRVLLRNLRHESAECLDNNFLRDASDDEIGLRFGVQASHQYEKHFKMVQKILPKYK